MKFLLLSVLALASGCQDYNSNTFDGERYRRVTLTGSAGFTPAYYVLQQRCASCHFHSEWGGYTSEQDWIDEGYVTKQDPDSSRVIFRIINHGGTDANMPLGLGPIPNDEYQDLVDWVENIP